MGEIEKKHAFIVGNGKFSCKCGASCAVELWAIGNGMNWYIAHLEAECLPLMAEKECVKCIHDVPLNFHCDKCYEVSLHTNQREIGVLPEEGR